MKFSVGANLVFVPFPRTVFVSFPQNRLLASEGNEYKIRPYGKPSALRNTLHAMK